jgi:outer membrane immunogenic protein
MTTLALIAFGAIAPAQAADMPVKAMPVKAPIVVPYSWAGFYIGLNGGYSWGRSDTTGNLYNNTSGALLATGSDSFKLNGGIFGGQAGYNWQSNNFVYGVEADIQWSGEKGGTIFTCPTPAGGGPCNLITGGPGAGVAPTASLSQKIEWFGTFRGRLGTTITPTVLLYVTGGLAYGDVKTDAVISGFTGGGVPVSAAFSNDSWHAGWTVGAGLEGSLGGKWTGKIEYLYMDLGTYSGSGTLLTSFPPLLATYSSRITDNILRAGVNYHF